MSDRATDQGDVRSGKGPKVRVVADVMTRDPLTATPSETIADVTAQMRDRKVGSIVVVDGRRAIGILTERDLVKMAASARPRARRRCRSG
jgi:CBS domain-containing protein